jgi:hypothetical protein
MRRQSSAAGLVFAVVALLGLAGPAAAGKPGKQVPFKGNLEGTVERATVPGDPRVFVLVEGEGNATHLGRFAFAAPHYVDPVTRTATGEYEFTAANGDTLVADFTGRATPTDTPGVLYIVETATITGGTGRFAGATGRFTVARLYDTDTGTTTGSFAGTVSSSGASKR